MHWPISSTLSTEPRRSVLHPEHLPALGHEQELQEATCGWQHEQLMFAHPCFLPFLLVGMKTTLLTLNRNTAQSSSTFKSTREPFWLKLRWWWNVPLVFHPWFSGGGSSRAARALGAGPQVSSTGCKTIRAGGKGDPRPWYLISSGPGKRNCSAWITHRNYCQTSDLTGLAPSRKKQHWANSLYKISAEKLPVLVWKAHNTSRWQTAKRLSYKLLMSTKLMWHLQLFWGWNGVA